MKGSQTLTGKASKPYKETPADERLFEQVLDTSPGSLHDSVSISSITIPKSQDESDETWHLCHGLVLVRLSNTRSEPFPVVPFAEVKSFWVLCLFLFVHVALFAGLPAVHF